MFARTALTATLLAFVSSAAAQLQIVSPGGPNLWWVAQSDNTVLWTCETSPYSNFTILIANSNPSVLASSLAIVAQQPNYDCSETISQHQISQPAASGYTLMFANPLNNSDIYATTQPFEIKALGAAYPPSSATPTATASATPSSSSGSSGSSSSSAPSATTSKSAASKVATSFGGMAVLGAVLGLVFA
ncbi:hypothetical protein AcW1_001591 [Taiwanofungus camphoratus]|nr:hypothetical protein AcV7_003560 [Antrodia cinnamomea]KAI0938759.1 hypothetical protein AcV5_000368 [Antrodia cinnamomea]KAI0945349.1 hypothetical protein AcW1_001591 [Antrodia cinnamomea]